MLDLLGERGTEHERLSSSSGRRHVAVLYDSPNLRLEAHVEHAIGLVQAQETAELQRNLASFHEVHEATGRGDEDVATAVKILQLHALFSASVDADGAQAGAPGELARFVVDLTGQLASGGEDQNDGSDLNAPAHA
jgi:hypothetical protein